MIPKLTSNYFPHENFFVLEGANAVTSDSGYRANVNGKIQMYSTN